MILVWTALATLGFGLLFRVRGVGNLSAATGVGTLGWAVYLGIVGLGWPSVAANFAAAVAVTGAAELGARIRKTAAASFLLPGLIPLVPGRALYETLERAVHRDFSGALAWGFEGVATAAALGVGVAAVSLGRRRRGRSDLSC